MYKKVIFLTLTLMILTILFASNVLASSTVYTSTLAMAPGTILTGATRYYAEQYFSITLRPTYFYGVVDVN